MAKITIVGDAMVVTSTKTLENIKTLEKYRPKALRLYEKNEDGEREEVYRVGSTAGKGSINQYGASFNSETHDEQKLATITVGIPAGTENVKDYVAEMIGIGVIRLNKVEEQIAAALTEVASERAAVMENITVA